MAVQNIAYDAALDIVDAHGPYAEDWPRDLRATLEQMERANVGFADHLAEMREIEDQLAHWDEADDGVEVGEEVAANGGDEADTYGEIAIDPDAVTDMDEMLAKLVERMLSDTAEPYRVFTKDLDTLTEIRTHGATLDKIQLATQASVGPLQKDLTRLIAARTQSTRLPGQRRGRIHAPNLHRVLSGDDRVFSRKQEAPALNTAITLLLDCSGSMNGGYYPGNTFGESWERTPFVLAIQSAYALATVLQRINVPCEVIGYTTGHTPLTPEYMDEVAKAHSITPITRYTPLSYPRFKEFHEPFSLEVQRRFAAAHDTYEAINKSGTIEGCSVEFAARRLLAQPQQRKLMIVMSDGKPAGPVYTPPGARADRNHFAYAHHAREMVKEVTAAGVEMIGVGIKYAEIQSYYPKSIVIDNVAEMPAKLMSVLKSFLTK